MGVMELHQLVLGSVSTNCYLAKNKETNEVVIVDPADRADRIEAKINEISGKPAAILLTHGHFDHILAAESLREKYGIQIYACRQEAGLLADAQANMSLYMGGKACEIKSDVLLDDLQVFRAGGMDFQLIHTPGHTPGSCCYYMQDEKVLFSGDTMFLGSCGRTDFPGGSMAAMQRSLRRLLSGLPEETEVFPGHDASTSIDYEKRYNPFV
ncbi:MAG: MBL fold metallo-hydrolase [Eubacteriales bacterium]|nr:MBL fold metallo-hydrolase [Eubacteriales bacterium]